MTIRNLDFLFKPRSVAIIGKGGKDDAPDAHLVSNLMRQGFNGPIMPLNPDRTALRGILCYKDLASLPIAPDLAVITTPMAGAPALISGLGELGTRAVLLLNEELLKSFEDGGTAMRQALLDAAKPNLIRIAGPDSFGLAAPRAGLNVTLGHTPILPGSLALLSQSCAITRAVLDWAAGHHIGFSHVLSVGAKIDVDFGDMLDYLARDGHVKSILLYLESIHDARKFMSAARAAARVKPVIVLRPSKYRNNPAEDAVYDSAFRRAGILRVSSIEQLFNSVEALGTAKPVYNNRLAVVGNSRAISLLATETLDSGGGQLAQFNEDAQAALAKILPRGTRIENPLDLGDAANGERYVGVLDVLLEATGVDCVLMLHSPISPEADLAAARAVATRAAKARRLVITSWLGADSAHTARDVFKKAQVATYDHPGDAVAAFIRIAQHRRNLDLLMETPPSIPESFTADTKRAQAILTRALAEGRSRLSLYEAMQVLDAYCIPTVDTRAAATPDEAAALYAVFGGMVTLKILSPDIDSKSEVGGVAMWLDSAAAVQTEAQAMIARVREIEPDARIEGFVVQPMLARAGAYELALGMRTGDTFGPLIRFGHGGTEADSINDKAWALPPLNMALAQELMSRTRIAGMLKSSRARAADTDAVALTLIKISQMAVELGELWDLDINPLRVSGKGVIALDATIRVAPYHGKRARDRLAIRPYPSELQQDFSLPDGRGLRLRPIVPEDEPPLQNLVKRMPPEELRLRFFQPIRELSHAMAARLTQLDYYREMALVVSGRETPGKADIYGVVRITCDPDMDRAEYAILVDHGMTGMGLGPMLMRRIIDYARLRGITEIYGEVLWENEGMLKLCRALGFTVKASADDPGIMHVSFKP
ncbi:bifunctional acetate--CoA ligase family protein/GNAT family N-acetyltransferase [Plasticicumulans acidivorans]|uniref:Acetyltransferase n=1 Tax=Plasticicumulans acidivorans TaxID=886464 RepID=A0A317MXJ7_9GAMM|nr:bifunctional acetate--CoA ligase family protein/GNAT family N-acetyltransferase [Plasticicumulans acidivorans]PWV63244.1 acetyltransferase [Plasticicumulans acidivorans]